MCGENAWAVVGTWLGLIVAAYTPAARLTVPRTVGAIGNPNRLSWTGMRLDIKGRLQVESKG